MQKMFTADFITDAGYVRRAIFADDKVSAYKQANQMAAENGEHFQFASIREVEGSFERVVEAKWIPQDSSLTKYSCSHCLSRNYEGHEARCPACGAHMVIDRMTK